MAHVGNNCLDAHVAGMTNIKQRGRDMSINKPIRICPIYESMRVKKKTYHKECTWCGHTWHSRQCTDMSRGHTCRCCVNS